jgi:isopenicillin-N epimerase
MPTYLLDPSVCFLNHGSFGATPAEVLALQDQFRKEMEAEPIDFLIRNHPARWSECRTYVANFLHADPAGTVFVHNATDGVNAVIQSFPWKNGDQILTTNHRYDAVRNTFEHMVGRQGVEVVEAMVPFPLNEPQDIIDSIEAAITPRTRLIAIDHITSPTAVIYPVNTLVELAHSKGIPILIDAAHAPGQIDVDIQATGADFWVGNLHKWLCAPKGVAILNVAEQWREHIHPTVISHGYGQGLTEEFNWCGTDDPTAAYCAPAAIKLHQAQGGATFRAAHHRLVQVGREVLADALEVDLPHPDTQTLYGSMAAIPLPCSADDVADLFTALRTEDGIEVPILIWDDRAWVRISGFSGYNRPEQYHQLATALRKRLIRG